MPNNTNTISNLPDTAMVVTYHASKWEGFKYDRELSEKLVSQHGAAKGAARVNKLIVPKEWIQPVTEAFGRVYTHHIKHTLPWMDNGQRILASRMHLQYSSEHKRLTAEAMAQVRVAINSYPTVLAMAPQRLNGMFKLSDFPKPEKLPDLFSISVGYLPIPVDDIRCAGVDESELERMNESKVQEIQRAIESANRDAWLRMYSAVAHMNERLKLYDEREQEIRRGKKVGKEGTFRDTVVENIRELVDLLPKMNFSGDGELDSMVDRLKRNLLRTDADGLRESTDERKRAMLQAERILKDMQPYVQESAC